MSVVHGLIEHGGWLNTDQMVQSLQLKAEQFVESRAVLGSAFLAQPPEPVGTFANG